MSTSRNSFVEGELANLETALGNPLTQELLGTSKINELRTIMANLTFANITDGIVTIPDDSGDSIPILAYKHGDKLSLGHQFDKPTESQRLSYIRQFTDLGLDNVKAESVSESISLPYTPNTPAIPRNEAVSATTKTASMVTSASGAEQMYGIKAHEGKTLVKLMMRPLVVIKYQKAAPDIVMHELEHAVQKTQRPLRQFGSQNDIDMDMLEDELYAYHVGASVRSGLAQTRPSEGDVYLQMTLDNLRLKVNGRLDNKFKPSRYLLAQYQQQGMSDIIESASDYDKLLDSVAQ